MIRGGSTLLALALAPAAAAAAAVPFVGCASDGQQGPQPAPRRGNVPPVAAAATAQLAYYASSELGVLAPRGWHCLGLEGSNGSSLIVTPEPHRSSELLNGTSPLHGPAVQIAFSYGGTSGRFAVANLIARAFPSYMGFARRVAAEGMSDPLPGGPYPADRMVRFRPTAVGYTTPAGQRGLGTDSWLAPDVRPIDGLLVLHPGRDVDMLKLDVRLPAAQPGLATIILNGALPRRGARR